MINSSNLLRKDNPEKLVIAPEKWYTNSKNQALYLKNKIYQEGWIRL